MKNHKCIVCHGTKNLIEMGDWAICPRCARVIYKTLCPGEKCVPEHRGNIGNDNYSKEDKVYELQN